MDKEQLTKELNANLDDVPYTIERMFCAAVLREGPRIAERVLARYLKYRDTLYPLYKEDSVQEHLLIVRFKCEEMGQALGFQAAIQDAANAVTVVELEKLVSLVGDEEIRGAVARAYTYPKNISKEMDRDLVEAAAREVTYL